jgi:hypothetical protein
MFPLLGGIGGAIAGFFFGVATRSTVMGMPIPLGVLTSSDPLDQQYAGELTIHLLLWVGGGLVLGALFGFALTQFTAQDGGFAMPASKGPLASTGKDYDLTKWRALKEVDPEIARAAAQASQKGSMNEDELARKYLSLMDKSYLPSILAKALAIAPIPTEGQIGPHQFKKGSDGWYKIVAGPRKGVTFATYEAMARDLGS